jgi:hypothetical protein
MSIAGLRPMAANSASGIMGLGIVRLTDLAVGIGARRVEIAQRHVPDAARRFGILQHPLDHELGIAVRVDRILRRILLQRHPRRNAIGRAGAREQQVLESAKSK